MLSPIAGAALGIAIAVLFILPIVPLLIESPGAAGLAAISLIMAGTAILAGTIALGAQATRMLPSDLGFGQELIVIGPYLIGGGFAAALLFALAALVAGTARR